MEQEHLQEFREFLEKTKGLSPKSVKDYLYWIRQLNPVLLTQEYINQYVQDRGNSFGIRGAMLNFLEYAGLLKTFDMPPKMTGRKPQRIIRDISRNEIEVVRDYLYKISFKKGLMFELIYQGALRRGEVPTIKLNSFRWLDWMNDIEKPCKLIVKGKGDKERVVLINSETAKKIFNYYDKKYNFNNIEKVRGFANSPSFLFTTEGNPIKEWFVWSVVHKGSKKSIGRDIRTHELRHHRATELERLGVPIRDIKNYLGHSSLATTEIYLHRSEKESIENIERILQKKEEKSIA